MLHSVGLFTLAGLYEIGGGYLVSSRVSLRAH